MESLDLLSEPNVQETEFTAEPLLKQSAWLVGKNFRNKSACHWPVEIALKKYHLLKDMGQVDAAQWHINDYDSWKALKRI
jgi:hypothetical protein